MAKPDAVFIYRHYPDEAAAGPTMTWSRTAARARSDQMPRVTKVVHRRITLPSR